MNDPDAQPATPRRRSQRRWIVAAALVTALLGAGFVAQRAAVAIVERQVIAALGAGAQVAHVGADWDAVEITGVRLPAGAGWPVSDALRAERVRIVPSWRSLLSDRIAIARIDVTGGYLSVLRTRDGRLRLGPTRSGSSDTPSPPHADGTASAEQSAARSVSIGVLQSVGGELEFFDESVARPPWKLHLQQIDATLRDLVAPAQGGQLPFELSAELAGPQRNGHLVVSGWLDPSTEDLDLTASLRAVDLLALQPYVVEESKQRLSGGALDLDIRAKVESRQLHAPGRLTLSQLQFAKGSNATTMALGVPRDLLLAGLQARGGKIALEFSLDGNIDDPQFSLHEMLSTRIAVGLAKQLGFSVGGLVEGIGGLGLEGLKGTDKAASGIGSALRKLIPHRK